MNRGFGRGKALVNAEVKRMLADIAERLQTRRPDEPLTTTARLAVLQATTMDPVLFSALNERVPQVTKPVLRKDFAVQVREIAEAM